MAHACTRRFLAIAATCVAALVGARAEAAAPPAVVVSIKPIHALVSGVMRGISDPRLLVPPGASPHAYALRPSDARALAKARMIVWVGPALEGFLARPITRLGRKAVVVALAEEAGLIKLAAREGGVWEPDADEPAHAEGHGESRLDPHVWLDPENGRRIVRYVAGRLAALDPERASAYAANAKRMIADIDAAEADVRRIVAPVRAVPYIVFHDAYQYFDRRFGTNSVGSITVSPERKPGAKRLYEIRRKTLAAGVRCVFAEPQFEPAVVQSILRGTAARAGTLDPLGTAVPPGPGAYRAILIDIAKSLRGCLSPES